MVGFYPIFVLRKCGIGFWKVLSPYLNVPEVKLKVGILHEAHIGIAEDGKRKLETYPHI